MTVDEEVVAAARNLGPTSLSAVVNTALINEMDRRARALALQQLLAQWESQLGPVPPAEQEAARAAFDELDGVVPPAEAVALTPEPVPAPCRRRGAA